MNKKKKPSKLALWIILLLTMAMLLGYVQYKINEFNTIKPIESSCPDSTTKIIYYTSTSYLQVCSTEKDINTILNFINEVKKER